MGQHNGEEIHNKPVQVFQTRNAGFVSISDVTYLVLPPRTYLRLPIISLNMYYVSVLIYD